MPALCMAAIPACSGLPICYFRMKTRSPGRAWKFASYVSYAAIVYSKTATLLGTLESVVGQETMRRALRVYFTRYRFKHPTGEDFLRTLEEVTGRDDLQPFLSQAINGTDLLDYSVDSLTSGPVDWWKI